MSLVCWLPLNGDLRNLGCSNITVTNNGATINTSGKIGSCYSFDGSSYLSFNKQIFDTNTFSVSFWIKANNISGNKGIINCRNASNKSFAIYLIGAQIRIDTGSNWSTGYSLTASTWTHITFTTDGVTERLYVNGIQSKNRSYTSVISTITNFCTIGCEHTNGSNLGVYFNGYLNDIRIYNHCLSAAEVREISQGLVLHYKLDGIGPSFGNPNLLIDGMTPTAAGNGATGITREIENGIQKIVAASPNNNWCTFGNHNTTLALTKGDTFTFSLMIRSPDSNKKPTVYFQSGLGYYGMQGTMSNNWSIIYYTGTWSIDNLQTNIHLGFSSAPGTYYIKYFKLEKGSSVTPWAPKEGEALSDLKYIEDSSGYNHNGIMVGNLTVTNSTPRYSSSTVFNGSSKIYNTTAPIRNTNGTPLTVSCWFYQSSRSGYRDLVTARSSNAYTWMLYTHTTDGSIQLHGSAQNKSTVIPDLNTWHHVAAVVNDNSTYNLYLDGVKVVSAASYSYQSQNADTINIGAYGSDTTIKEGWIGYISDVRIYCTSLDDDAIRQLYEVSAKVDNKQNLHAFELVENNSKIQITKCGQVECNELEEDEKTKFYQADQIIETNEIIEL